MRILPIILLLSLICSSISAQKINWEDTSVSFGSVQDWDSPPAVFRLTNTGITKLMFLPQHYGRDVQVVLPNRSIQPGETAEVIIHYYTANTGPFSKTVEVFSNASDKAQSLTVRGNISSLRNNALTACPTFGNDMPTASSNSNVITVVDRVTSEQIEGARVEIFKRDDSRAVYETDQRGIVRSKLESGKYTAQVEKVGYFPSVQEFAFGRGLPSVIVFLEPKRSGIENGTSKIIVHTTPADIGVDINDQWAEGSDQKTESLGVGVNEQWDDGIVREEPKAHIPASAEMGVGINNQWEEKPASKPAVSAPIAEPVNTEDLGVATDQQWTEQKPDPEAAIEAALAAAEPTPEFAATSFKPNNILLLIDASSSMGKDGKMEKLKVSVGRMIGMLRPIDKLSIVAYNSSAWTVLPPTLVSANDSIIALVEKLEPESYTNGVKGMTEAYDQLLTEWVEGGNNQLIIATDGMFNSSKFTEKDAIELASLHAKRGIILSVVGFGDDEDAEKTMKRIARVGKGAYLQIDGSANPAGLLAEEIKTRSRKL
jgi:hypothetical protein